MCVAHLDGGSGRATTVAVRRCLCSGNGIHAHGRGCEVALRINTASALRAVLEFHFPSNRSGAFAVVDHAFGGFSTHKRRHIVVVFEHQLQASERGDLDSVKLIGVACANRVHSIGTEVVGTRLAYGSKVRSSGSTYLFCCKFYVYGIYAKIGGRTVLYALLCYSASSSCFYIVNIINQRKCTTTFTNSSHNATIKLWHFVAGWHGYTNACHIGADFCSRAVFGAHIDGNGAAGGLSCYGALRCCTAVGPIGVVEAILVSVGTCHGIPCNGNLGRFFAYFVQIGWCYIVGASVGHRQNAQCIYAGVGIHAKAIQRASVGAERECAIGSAIAKGVFHIVGGAQQPVVILRVGGGVGSVVFNARIGRRGPEVFSAQANEAHIAQVAALFHAIECIYGVAWCHGGAGWVAGIVHLQVVAALVGAAVAVHVGW